MTETSVTLGEISLLGWKELWFPEDKLVEGAGEEVVVCERRLKGKHGGGAGWPATGFHTHLPSLDSCSPNPAQASLSHQHPSHSESLAG